MEKQPKWCSARTRIRGKDPLEEITRMAEVAYGASSKSRNFAVFSVWEEHDETRPYDYRLVYFSPLAALFCETLINNGEFTSQECDRPSPDEPGLALAVGDEATAWDLLK